MASAASINGYVRSMTGVTLPASISSRRICRSSLLGFAINGRSVWLTNGDKRTALMSRPTGPMMRPGESPLLRTSLPLRLRARRQADGEAVPAS